MDNEPEVIRHQMEETRQSLQDKLEVLEQQVLSTVQEGRQTVEAVRETVESVKDTVQETVETVKETVQGTVSSVKDTMQETVESVKETFNLERQVREHPWTMVAGATAVGFLGGKLLLQMIPQRHAMVMPSGRAYGIPAAPPQAETAFRERPNGAAPAQRVPEKPSLLSKIASHYSDEIDKVKALAISTLGSVAREYVIRSAAPPLAERINDVVDRVTTKLGGQPMKEPIFDFGSRAAPSERKAASEQCAL